MILVCCQHQMNLPSPSGPKPPQRVSLAGLTAQSLRDSMQAGHWQGHLPGERELCARLQVSRSTLRSALDAAAAHQISANPRDAGTFASDRHPFLASAAGHGRFLGGDGG
jgi:DNA-binding FadR family transcriptional regulator